MLQKQLVVGYWFSEGLRNFFLKLMTRSEFVQPSFQVSFFFSSRRNSPSLAKTSQCGSFTIPLRHTTLASQDSSERVISPFQEYCTWQLATHTTDRYPCPRWYMKAHSQQASGRRPLGHCDRLVKLCYSLKLAAYSFDNVAEGWV
jgi:hypothetical protein